MTNPAAGPALLMVVIEVDPAREDEFNRWYDEEHIPEKRSAPGFRSARRFAEHEGRGRYMALYEIDSPDTVLSAEYMTQEMSPWTLSIMTSWHSIDRTVWVEVTVP